MNVYVIIFYFSRPAYIYVHDTNTIPEVVHWQEYG